MTRHDPDDLWRDFPKTATEFEERFASEEDCRAYWIEARWGGTPTCARCNSTRLWSERGMALLLHAYPVNSPLKMSASVSALRQDSDRQTSRLIADQRRYQQHSRATGG